MDTTNMIRVPSAKPFRDMPLYNDFRELISGIAESYQNDIAYIIKTKRATKESPAEYRTRTFIELKDDVNNFGLGLVKEGLLNKRLAIISKNRYEWMVAYYAQLSGVGICVPLDKDLPYEELESSMVRSEAKVIVFDKDHWDIIKKLSEAEGFSDLVMICMDGKEACENSERVLSFNDVMKKFKD